MPAPNFVGRPLPGYDAAECILRQDAAAALKRVQAGLAASGLCSRFMIVTGRSAPCAPWRRG
jgi:D-alanyl-D-alanine dipeptidase